MSLPGLELAEAAADAHHAPPPPTQVNLRAGSEWRFEIAFGATVRVKVRQRSYLEFACIFEAICADDKLVAQRHGRTVRD